MISVNFLRSDPDASATRKTRILAGVFAIIVAVISIAGATASYRSSASGTNVFDEFVRLPGVSDVSRLVLGNNINSITQLPANRDTVNILILGIGGPGHEGSLLTDTIILASVDVKQKKVAMLSIPRDLAWKREDGFYEKINSVHAWEEQDHPGEGAKRTAEKFSAFFETPIDHVLRIDFRGFASLIDALGGVNINVERSFSDSQYPTSDEGWTAISFAKGEQHMSGQTALVFVRSRHGNNGEGSDFARSRRQQLVLMAVRERLLSLNTLTDPGKLARLYTTLASHIQTDLTPWDAIDFAPLAREFDASRIETHVLTDADDGELVPNTINGNFLLFPKGNNWDMIKSLAQNPFQSKEDAAQKGPILAKVEVKNGTNRTGFAYQVTNELKLSGFDATNIGNASKRTYKRTLIFDLTEGKKPDDLAKLRLALDADLSVTAPVSTTGTDGIVHRTVYADAKTKETVLSPKTDFLVILGGVDEPMAATSTPSEDADQTKP